MNEVFMRRALELAKKGKGRCSPNPCVGAVIVKGGQIISEGWHKGAGKKHAEVEAVEEVMKKSGVKSVDVDPSLFRNAVLYVTLEPCAHTGKTAPCLDLVLKCGFSKICIGMKDPFHLVNGKSIRVLKRSGAKVEVLPKKSLLAKEIFKLNQSFIKSSQYSLPYVCLKSGMTMDACIASSTGDSKWISSDTARLKSRKERGYYDAILVGSSTVIEDNPVLSAAGRFASKKILRVIIDRKLSTDTSSNVYRDEMSFVAATDLATKKSMSIFKEALIPFKSFGKESVSIIRLLKYLHDKMGVRSLLVEGGGVVNSLFHQAWQKNNKAVDKIDYYYAPLLFGGSDAKSVFSLAGGSRTISKSLWINDIELEKIDDNFRVHGYVNFYQS